MKDVTRCVYKDACPLRARCLRATEPPTERSSWFRPMAIGEDCADFIEEARHADPNDRRPDPVGPASRR